MAGKFLDRVYKASGNDEMREIYDDWAEEYDQDVEGNGYLTPKRLAETLTEFVTDQDTAILDYGCGTGLSGVALSEEGFSKIDGADLSEKMLEIAEERDVYRKLQHIEPEEPLDEQIGEYEAITAVGVVSKGAAPPFVYGDLLGLMKPGAVLALSLNDLSLSDPEYSSLIPDSVEAGKVRILSEEHGPHLAKYGKNSGSTVYVLERLA